MAQAGLGLAIVVQTALEMIPDSLNAGITRVHHIVVINYLREYSIHQKDLSLVPNTHVLQGHLHSCVLNDTYTCS